MSLIDNFNPIVLKSFVDHLNQLHRGKKPLVFSGVDNGLEIICTGDQFLVSINGKRIIEMKFNRSKSRGDEFMRCLTNTLLCGSCERYEMTNPKRFKVQDFCSHCSVSMLTNIFTDNCSICLDPLASYATRTTNCNHTYHVKCFDKLTVYDKYCDQCGDSDLMVKCPLCRQFEPVDSETHICFDDE